MPQNTNYKEAQSDNQAMPTASEANAYRNRLNAWTIARIISETQRETVARFRTRSDADGYIQHLRQVIPDGTFQVFFDCQREEAVI
ncbi:hypothetical protein VB711_07945 [Cronbergia sp. UHCC 0137]|uniref:hypothetical protein n=1 Tax=Cronbergia sp. UHCC 0137 TaxID=3110239 RepID=UPI002B1E9E0D|nr:hypothetical protein [Cronbergia sp. UHCC 0137]MEA5617769.1 hypothetical protein [Cronbergia sp. UHCC 0137]